MRQVGGEIPVLNTGLPLILSRWSADAAGGMSGVAVKCLDITQNTDCEGIWRIRN